MARLQLIRQSPRRLGNDLKAADDGLKPHEVVTQALEGLAVREALSRVDVKENIAERAAFFLRRHRRHHAPKARADEA